MARSRKRTEARASASRSSCRRLQALGDQHRMAEGDHATACISREVSRGSTGSNSPLSMPSRRISSMTLRMTSPCAARMASQLSSIAISTMSLTRLLGEEIFLVVVRGSRGPAAPAAGGRWAARARDRPGLLVELAEAALADRLDDGVLGGEEAVDVGRRHAELGGDVGDRGLGEAQPTEQRLRGLDDAGAGVVGLGLDLGVHCSIPAPLGARHLMTDDYDNSSVIPCQAPFRAPQRWGLWPPWRSTFAGTRILALRMLSGSARSTPVTGPPRMVTRSM